MKTIKELANIGARASALLNKGCGTLAVTRNHPGWHHDEEQRQAFAAAVRDVMLADMFPKLVSGTSVKPIPLTMDDIHPPNQAPAVEAAGICTDCGGEVTHREGKHGEFDHKCDTEKPEPKPTTFEAREATA